MGANNSQVLNMDLDLDRYLLGAGLVASFESVSARPFVAADSLPLGSWEQLIEHAVIISSEKTATFKLRIKERQAVFEFLANKFEISDLLSFVESLPIGNR